MKLIPVIDLKGGEVVHARRGERDSYRPIVSPLCRGSRPEDVVAGLLGVYPFDSLYIADLGAIQGQRDHAHEIAALGRAFPQLELWVDCGLGDAGACRDWLARNAGSLVLGSEAVRDPQILRRLGADLPRERLILSLDYRGDGFLGPPELLEHAEDWPARVIAMTLARVGSGAGPDFARLDEVKRHGRGRDIFAAGGVRGGEDLLELARRGISGVLVASALHERRIGRAEIDAADAASS
jgi:phosphoribosylformimino-5-aminoimidazole carboxamide ribotide isomerase